MRNALTLIMSFMTTVSFAQVKITPEEAKNHINEIVEIRGKISEIIYSQNSKKRSTVITVGGKSPNQLVTIIIPNNARNKLGFDLTEKKYAQGVIIAKGKVSLSKGKPTIVISGADQIGFIYDEEVVPSN